MNGRSRKRDGRGEEEKREEGEEGSGVSPSLLYPPLQSEIFIWGREEGRRVCASLCACLSTVLDEMMRGRGCVRRKERVENIGCVYVRGRAAGGRAPCLSQTGWVVWWWGMLCIIHISLHFRSLAHTSLCIPFSSSSIKASGRVVVTSVEHT